MIPNRSAIAGLYNQANARGATPLGLIVTQFDQVIRDLRRAVVSLDLGNIEERTRHLNHALLVIAQLQNVLNHQEGGEAAKHFEQFYNVTRSMLMEAQILAKREKLLECIELYSTLRLAWHQASQMASSAPASDPATALATTPATISEITHHRSQSIEPHADQGSWNA